MHPPGSEEVTAEQLRNVRYAVISPVRNEVRFIEQTIQAMVDQSVKPAEWVIVDDDSTDKTPEIVATYAERYPWIRLVHRERKAEGGDRRRGKGVVDTFYYGYDRLTGQDHEFIVKLDGDVAFGPTYFEFLLREFFSNPELGIAGGGLYERVDGKGWTLRSDQDHVGGPAKMYRRACFEAIGGLAPALGWDGLDEWQALALGWRVQSFPELELLHYRVMGQATGHLKSKVEMGYGAHYMGYHPLYLFVRGIRHMVTQPYVVGGMAMIAAYLVAWAQGREQLPGPLVIRYIRHTQLKQLGGLLIGKRVYKS